VPSEMLITCVQVRGSRPSDQYIVFPRHYCSCQAFLYVVVGHDNPLVSLSLPLGTQERLGMVKLELCQDRMCFCF
jgi:hypothetical protein